MRCHHLIDEELTLMSNKADILLEVVTLHLTTVRDFLILNIANLSALDACLNHERIGNKNQ